MAGTWILLLTCTPTPTHAKRVCTGIHFLYFPLYYGTFISYILAAWYAELVEAFCFAIHTKLSQPKCRILQTLQRGNIFTVLSTFPKKSYKINNVSFMAWFRYTSFSIINCKHWLTYILGNIYDCHAAGCFHFHVPSSSNMMVVLIRQSEIEAMTFIEGSSLCMVVEI